jgi:hypothetical protein
MFPKKNKFSTNAMAKASPHPKDESDEEISHALANISLASSQVTSTTAEGQSAHDAQNTWV